jgi:heme-degrading monooxygenase HmoA
MPAVPTDRPTRPVARTWRGATRVEDADAYLVYLEGTGFKSYRETPGNLGVIALRRRRGSKAEFLLLSVWESEEAIRQFAGDPIDRAVFYPEDDRFLIERDTHVDHYEVVYRDGGLS